MPEKDDPPRIDTVAGMLHEEYTGQLVLAKGDNRFKCSECQAPISTWRGLGPTRMYVDSEERVWCGSCWYRCLETTTRSMTKNPDDPHPKYIHGGNKYYQRLKRDFHKLEKWNE